MLHSIGTVVGVMLALATCAIAHLSGLGRERAFYPAMLMAIATYDVLFATMTGASAAIVTEVALASVFVALGIIGYRYSMWIVAAGLAAHGVADLVHDAFAPDSGIPAWWPAFCCAFDVVAALVLATVLYRGRGAAHGGS